MDRCCRTTGDCLDRAARNYCPAKQLSAAETYYTQFRTVCSTQIRLQVVPARVLPYLGDIKTTTEESLISPMPPSPFDVSASAALLDSPAIEPGTATRLQDSFGRAITDLRISVTDRCNYKCVYCRTGNEGAQYTELPIAQYLRMVRILVSLGIEKVRLTGGEPLLRNGLVEMVAELAKMRTAYRHDGSAYGPEEAGGSLDIALTTNGHLLEGLAGPLKAAGLNRVTVSMDA